MPRQILFFFYAMLLLTACSGPGKNDDGRQVFRYNESAGITSLDPAFARNQANIWAVNQLFNGLTQLDDNLNVKPCIAQSWDVSSNGLVYTFKLRNDVYFHPHPLFKGKQRRVTASDFSYSFNRITDKKTASPGAWVFNAVAHDENGKPAFDVLNDTTLRITLAHPFPPFPGILSMQYCSVVPHEVCEYYGKDFRKNPVGTGPFYFKMWKEGVKLVLLKNENYFETDTAGIKLPYLDAVAITFVIDKQTAFLEFVKGNIDFISGIDASYKDELLTHSGMLNPKYTEKFSMSRCPYLNTEYLGFIVDNDIAGAGNPLADKRIRQAINYGFDRSKMMRYLRNSIGIPGTSGIIPPGMPSADTTCLVAYNYNPAKSRSLLAEAGYPGGKGLPPITLSTNPSYADMAQHMQSDLADIGITIKLNISDPGALREQIAKSQSPFFRGSWIADYPDAENYLSLFYSKNFCPAGPNYTHYSNPAFDALYEKSLSELNDTLRYKLYSTMDSLMIADAPVVILYYDEVLRFTQKNISGMGINPLNLLTLKYVKKL